MQKTQEISSIIRKYAQGECTHQELDYAISLFEEPYQNLAIRPQLSKIWNEDDTEIYNTPSEEELNEVLNHIHNQINLNGKKSKASKIRHLFMGVSKIAAILIIGVIIGLFVNYFRKTEPVYYTSYAPLGSVSQMLLPDNTMVYLNAGSKLKYVFNSDSDLREVYLEGEAWFDVEKNENKKFVVHTSYYDVNVLGTEFNVKAYPEDDLVSTTLEGGSIQITSTDQFKIQNNQVLKPGEQLIYDKKDNKIELRKVNTRRYTSWKENKLIFIDMSLKELIVLLERKYGVDIKIDDKSLLDLHYDGTLRNETIIEVLEILQETLPIHYNIEDQEIHITKTNSN